MENATKALLIAGSVLLAILILTVFIVLYRNFSDNSNVYKNAWSSTELNNFNSTFEAFVGRNDVTAQDIVTLYNKIEEYKEKGIDIELSVPDKTRLQNSSIEFLQKNMDKKYQFSSIEYDSNLQMVKKISFN